MGDDLKARAQARFGAFAQGYVESRTHAAGADLERLVELAVPQPDWRVLDVATGGGHTALKFAPLVGMVIALDLTLAMLQAARRFIQEKGVRNIEMTVGDAGALPFPAASFDLVTCRIAPHHFPDCFRFVQECARVLKPGGMLLVEDNTVPDDERAARYVDAFERLRDPSHHRLYAPYEWEGMFLDAGLMVTHLEIFDRPGNWMLPWAERQGCTPQVIERLHVLLAQAPEAVRAFWNPVCAGTPDARFDFHDVMIAGRK
jgi:SAM-dependent methyltransferase